MSRSAPKSDATEPLAKRWQPLPRNSWSRWHSLLSDWRSTLDIFAVYLVGLPGLLLVAVGLPAPFTIALL